MDWRVLLLLISLLGVGAQFGSGGYRGVVQADYDDTPPPPPPPLPPDGVEGGGVIPPPP